MQTDTPVGRDETASPVVIVDETVVCENPFTWWPAGVESPRGYEILAAHTVKEESP